MIIPCVDCGGTLDWSLHRVGNQAMMASKCRHCSPAGPWQHEPVDVIRKPRGKAGIWPAPTDAPIVTPSN